MSSGFVNVQEAIILPVKPPFKTVPRSMYLPGSYLNKQAVELYNQLLASSDALAAARQHIEQQSRLDGQPVSTGINLVITKQVEDEIAVSVAQTQAIVNALIDMEATNPVPDTTGLGSQVVTWPLDPNIREDLRRGEIPGPTTPIEKITVPPDIALRQYFDRIRNYINQYQNVVTGFRQTLVNLPDQLRHQTQDAIRKAIGYQKMLDKAKDLCALLEPLLEAKRKIMAIINRIRALKRSFEQLLGTIIGVPKFLKEQADFFKKFLSKENQLKIWKNQATLLLQNLRRDLFAPLDVVGNCLENACNEIAVPVVKLGKGLAGKGQEGPKCNKITEKIDDMGRKSDEWIAKQVDKVDTLGPIDSLFDAASEIAGGVGGRVAAAAGDIVRGTQLEKIKKGISDESIAGAWSRYANRNVPIKLEVPNTGVKV